MQLFLVILIGINFFYIESLRDPVFCIVLYGLVAGAWLPSEVAKEEPPKKMQLS